MEMKELVEKKKEKHIIPCVLQRRWKKKNVCRIVELSGPSRSTVGTWKFRKFLQIAPRNAAEESFPSSQCLAPLELQ